ncbi:MAG: hypothetical protein KJZ77_02505 [Anaerolineales bacterium]|nr:hypothetical protein [Anaerolineales bacterium]
MQRTILIMVLLLLLLTGCAQNQNSQTEQINRAVAATLTALPAPTEMAQPTPPPPPTPFSLAGLFCEYQFCIGHPVDIAFFDVSAQQNPAAPSTYSQGLIAAFNANLFMQLIWQFAPGTADPKFIMDTIINDGLDTREGQMEVMLIRDMNVVYINIASTATPVLPYGGVGAWTCGDRVFAWKGYTPLAENARPLFDEALSRFACE